MPAPAAKRAASPFRLNLEQQRKRAKELLKALQAGEAEALQRFRGHHPRWSHPDQGLPLRESVRLSEAQFVIARELGLPSWPRLKIHITALDRSWSSIQRGEGAPDGDTTTLHLRCGTDIRHSLEQAGFSGEFLEYSDPFCQGPVLDDPGWLDVRADFLSRTYRAGSGMGPDGIAAKLRAAEDGLHAASGRYERVVLWFEHDTYDQLILARCLAAFAERPPLRLELISPARYPGGARFIGLGQLPPEALRLLWAERVPVPPGALEMGRTTWAALRAPDPRALARLAAQGTTGIPQLGRALRRHCQELPWTSDGLGLTERLILQIVAEQPRSVAEVFRTLTLEREPLPWMTDLIIHDMVEALRQAAHPIFTGVFNGSDRHWASEILTVTPLGRAVLAGEVDWQSLGPPDRWVGGVAIPGSAPCWRWNEATASVLRG